MLNRIKPAVFFAAFVLLFTASHVGAESSDGKKGWLKKLAAPPAAPSEEPTPTIGVRGLDEAHVGNPQARDYPAVDRLDRMQPSVSDLDTFKKEGKLP